MFNLKIYEKAKVKTNYRRYELFVMFSVGFLGCLSHERAAVCQCALNKVAVSTIWGATEILSQIGESYQAENVQVCYHCNCK